MPHRQKRHLRDIANAPNSRHIKGVIAKLTHIFKHWRSPKLSSRSQLFGQHLTKRQAQAFKVLSVLIVLTSIAYIVVGHGPFQAGGDIQNQAFVTWTGGSASSNIVVTTIQGGGPAQCSDGLDNDGDGKVDFPADPGCTNGQDGDETDPNTPPPAQCNDGIDNDNDGKIDYPSDLGCTDANDNDERDIDKHTQVACVLLQLEYQPPKNLNAFLDVHDKNSGVSVATIKDVYDYQSKKITVSKAVFTDLLQSGTTYTLYLKVDKHLRKKFDWTFTDGGCPTSPKILFGDVRGRTQDGNDLEGSENLVSRAGIVDIIRAKQTTSEYKNNDIVTAIRNYVQGAKGD